MEHAVENFGTIAPCALVEFTRKVTAVEDVEQVYLSEVTGEGLIMTYIVKEDFVATSSDCTTSITEIMKSFPEIRYRIYGYSYARKELEIGNLFFVKNCLGQLVYKKALSEAINGKKRIDVGVLKKAASRFKEEIERINSFTEGINFYRKRKEWSGAAFLIHQKIEWLYRCLETFAMGKPLICHKIKNHLAYAHPFIHDAEPLFNASTEQQLTDVLDRAYTESRYHSAFDISEKEVKVLQERAAIMENQVREIFKVRSDECYELLKASKNFPESELDKEASVAHDDEENALNLLKKIILQELRAVKIISFGKRAGFRERQSFTGVTETHSFTHYDLLIITSETSEMYPSKISRIISQKSEGELATTIIMTTCKRITQALKKRNEFVHRVITSGTIIYSDPNFSFKVPVYENSAEKLEIIRRQFFYRHHRATCFLAAADHVSGDDEATEISLQHMALQQICLGSIYIMLGLRPDCLKLEYLFDLCSNFSNAPNDCFPRRSPEDQRLFKKLTNSLNEVKYRTSNRRSLVDVDILFSRCEHFLEEMKVLSEQKLEALKMELNT